MTAPTPTGCRAVGSAALYLRPFMFATEVGLGRPTRQRLPLPADRLAGWRVLPARRQAGHASGCPTEYTRAAPGGTGEAKCAGNYAGVAGRAGAGRGRAGLRPGGLARRGRAPLGRGDGRDEPLLRPRHRRRRDDRDARARPAPCCRASPATRSSAGARPRAARRGGPARRPTTGRRATQSGEISEVFACGTAAVITPVGAVKSARRSWTVGDGQTGPVTTRLRQALLDIQTGAGAGHPRLAGPARPRTREWTSRLDAVHRTSTFAVRARRGSMRSTTARPRRTPALGHGVRATWGGRGRRRAVAGRRRPCPPSRRQRGSGTRRRPERALG